MAVSFSKITDVFGAEVDGVDIAAGVGETAMRDIVDLFNEYSILVFHDQKINDEQQIRFSRLFSEIGHFGGLEKTVVQNASGGTEIADLSNIEPGTKSIIPPTDKRMVFNSGNEMWHTDSSFKRVPATASLLSGREVPPTGGETEFATERAAYAALSVAMRERIGPLVAIHDFAYNRSLIDPNLMTEEQKRETPPVPQAVVRANPANGRKNFYAGAHASHIRGMPLEEGRALLGELTTIATQPQYTLRHTWRANDLVIWDNRCCLHRGRPWDKTRYRRVMYRTTVAGVGPTAE